MIHQNVVLKAQSSRRGILMDLFVVKSESNRSCIFFSSCSPLFSFGFLVWETHYCILLHTLSYYSVSRNLNLHRKWETHIIFIVAFIHDFFCMHNVILDNNQLLLESAQMSEGHEVDYYQRNFIYPRLFIYKWSLMQNCSHMHVNILITSGSWTVVHLESLSRANDIVISPQVFHFFVNWWNISSFLWNVDIADGFWYKM